MHVNPTLPGRSGRVPWRAILRDRRGLAFLEFAFSLPLVLTIGVYGMELSNEALVNMKVSQIALNLADNASRVGVTPLSTEQLREIDMNDVLQAAKLQGAGIGLTTTGRVTVSSLEADANGNQVIHWQRCIGAQSGAKYDSSYGTTTTTAGTDTSPGNAGTASPGGMGDAGHKVTAPASSGVMFVEVNYLYTPIIGNWLIQPFRMHYVASYIVRDNRDFAQIYNPDPAATRSTCDLHTV